MKVFLSNNSGVPAYQQIETQIKQQILNGEIAEGYMLPSIRMLAKQLGIGVITAKRAYDDLAAEGFVYTVQGKGVFAAKIAAEDRLSAYESEVKSRLNAVISYAEECGLSPEKIKQIVNKSMEDYDGRGNKNN